MDQDKLNNKNQKLIASFAVILVVVIVAVGVTFLTKKDNKTSDTSSTVASTTSGTASTSHSSATASSSSTYKDGTYSADGSYDTPGGTETITVNVTVKGGVVADTSLVQHANNHDTEEYQSTFASGYKSKVVGKALNSISLSRVSGSSLTSKGFNAALETIKQQAAS